MGSTHIETKNPTSSEIVTCGYVINKQTSYAHVTVQSGPKIRCSIAGCNFVGYGPI